MLIVNISYTHFLLCFHTAQRMSTLWKNILLYNLSTLRHNLCASNYIILLFSLNSAVLIIFSVWLRTLDQRGRHCRAVCCCYCSYGWYCNCQVVNNIVVVEACWVVKYPASGFLIYVHLCVCVCMREDKTLYWKCDYTYLQCYHWEFSANSANVYGSNCCPIAAAVVYFHKLRKNLYICKKGTNKKVH